MIGLFLSLLLTGDEPLIEKPTKLTIGLDKSWESRILHSELTRDWTQPNKEVWDQLSPDQRNRAYKRGIYFNNIIEEIKGNFDIEFLEYDIGNELYYTKGDYPKYKIRDNGVWKEFPKEAFKVDTWSLLTVRCIHDQWFLDYSRQKQKDVWSVELKKIKYHNRQQLEKLHEYLNKQYKDKYIYYARIREKTRLVAWDTVEEEWAVLYDKPPTEDNLSEINEKYFKNKRYQWIRWERGKVIDIDGGYKEGKFSYRRDKLDISKIPEELLAPELPTYPFMFVPAKFPWEEK